MSITLDIVIKDTLHRILDAADKEDLKRLSKIVDLKPKTLESIRDCLDKELDVFYNEFLKDEEE